MSINKKSVRLRLLLSAFQWLSHFLRLLWGINLEKIDFAIKQIDGKFDVFISNTLI